MKFAKVLLVTILALIFFSGCAQMQQSTSVLKGMRIGDAQISPKHANFVVNLGPSTGSGQGQAKATDVKALIDLAQEQVREQFGVELELEIELIGEWS